MVYAETVVKLASDGSEKFGVYNRVVVAYMDRECVNAGRDRPNVKVVNAAHPFGFKYRGLDGVQIYMPRRTFEQDVYRIKDQSPCSENYDKADQDTAHCVGPDPAECEDKHACSGRVYDRNAAEMQLRY